LLFETLRSFVYRCHVPRRWEIGDEHHQVQMPPVRLYKKKRSHSLNDAGPLTVGRVERGVSRVRPCKETSRSRVCDESEIKDATRWAWADQNADQG